MNERRQMRKKIFRCIVLILNPALLTLQPWVPLMQATEVQRWDYEGL